MDLPSAADEGEPGSKRQQTSYAFPVLIFLCSLSIVIACNGNRKNETDAPAKRQQHLTDSLQQAKRMQQLADSITAIKKKATAKKKIYLTFDDGPNKGTLNVLNAVKEEQVAVSFFIVGKHVFDSPAQQAVWEQLKADSAIELCNHSYTHALNRYTKFYNDPAGVVADFRKSDEKLDFNNHVVRMPGRNAWRIDSIRVTDIKESRAAIDSVHKAGFDIMGWDIEWSFDHKTFAPDTATGIILRRIRNMLDAGTTRTPGHLVLLAHDQAFQKEEYVQQLLDFLKELKGNEDYEFIMAGKYPGVRGY
ncbi:MAG: polysaccharide deacetylase family protein [Chitinophagaceae bacterium]|nr:polysaccharide deacetylase family protein [Chitinophagaceae bacterium]